MLSLPLVSQFPLGPSRCQGSRLLRPSGRLSRLLCPGGRLSRLLRPGGRLSRLLRPGGRLSHSLGVGGGGGGGSVMNLVATHYISCTTLQLHITYGLHLPSFTALTHSHPPLHQSQSCHQSLIYPDCLTTSAPHSHTHTHTHTHISSTLPCKHCEVLFLPRLTFLSVIHPAICYLCV